MEQWQTELQLIPIGHMLTVQKTLRDVGRVRAAQLLDAYEERIAMMTEGKEPTPKDISAAWSSVLNMTDLMPRLKNEDE